MRSFYLGPIVLSGIRATGSSYRQPAPRPCRLPKLRVNPDEEIQSLVLVAAKRSRFPGILLDVVERPFSVAIL